MALSNGVQIGLAAAVALGLLGGAMAMRPFRADEPASIEPQATALEGGESPDGEADAAVDGPRAAGPAASVAALPTFDLVRVEPDGRALVAGQAAPGATVAVLVDGEPAAVGEADADGRFVAFLDLAPSGAPLSLSLRVGGVASAETVIVAPPAAAMVPAPPDAAPDDAPEEVARLDPSRAAATSVDRASAGPSEDSVGTVTADPHAGEVGAPVPAEGPALAGPLPDPSGQPETRDAPRRAGAEPSGTASALPGASDPSAGPTIAVAEAALGDAEGSSPAPTAPETGGPEAGPPAVPGQAASPDPSSPDGGRPAVLVADAAGVRVLQPALPPGADARVMASVALDAIAYDGAGAVTLSGRARGGGAVRLYLDNAAVAEVAVGPDGSWRAPLADAAPGVHALRVDEVDTRGEVLSRIETPFLREDRAALAAALGRAGEEAGGRQVAVRTVQPGNTLWAIARERYGEPTLYVRLFEANRDRIRDPDLIYPGQVFLLPEP